MSLIVQNIFVLVLTASLLILLYVPSSKSESAGYAETSVDRRHVDQDSRLLEIGQGPNPRLAKRTFPNLKVISYNIRWRSGDDLQMLAQLLRDDPEIGDAAILGLQEVDRNKIRSGNRNTAKILAQHLGMHYAWAAPPVATNSKEEETGVAILSAYPLTDVSRLVLPHKGPGGRRRVALGATIKIGQADVRVYSVHAETRIPLSCKLEQMRAVIDELACYSKDMQAIILGDFNTWDRRAVSKTFELFAASSFHTPFDEQATFFRRALFIPIELKLDWIWLRNLKAASHGINQKIKLSDHWPLWMTLR